MWIIWALAFVGSTTLADQLVLGPATGRTTSFTLQHAVHLAPNRPALHHSFRPSTDPMKYQSSSVHSLRATRERAWHPSSPLAFQAARRSSYYTPRAKRLGRPLTAMEQLDAERAAELEWEEDDIVVPDVSDVWTLRQLAVMCNNAYTPPSEEWWKLDKRWNVSESYGWLDDGMRGHVFADEKNETIVVSIKGSSVSILGGSSDATSRNDKANDNLLFSCCCARVGWSWTPVCDCYSGEYRCSQDCLEDAVMSSSTYYSTAIDLYDNITALYPHAQIWLTGHSLGGSLAALLSLTFGVPSVSFESPGDALPTRRLHLPRPPTPNKLTTHVYHTADPIAMGTCNGVTSSCALAGFAFETRCHVGQSIVYDSVGRLGWAVDVRSHSIQRVIEGLLVEDWGVKKVAAADAQSWLGGLEVGAEDGSVTDDGQHGGRGVPDAVFEQDCESECFRWSFE